MADRVLTWYIAGVLSIKGAHTNVREEYVLDADYVPVGWRLRQKVAQAGDATIVDINDDGVSIFSLRPAINQGILDSEGVAFLSTLTVMEEGSVITLDIDQVSGTTPGSDLTVHLELNKA